MELAAAGVEGDDPPPLYSEEEYENGAFCFVDPALERTLMYISIAEVLGISALDVPRIPAHWSGAASILLDARQIARERESSRKKKK